MLSPLAAGPFPGAIGAYVGEQAAGLVRAYVVAAAPTNDVTSLRPAATLHPRKPWAESAGTRPALTAAVQRPGTVTTGTKPAAYITAQRPGSHIGTRSAYATAVPRISRSHTKPLTSSARMRIRRPEATHD